MGNANFFGEAYGAKQDPLGLFNSTGALPPTSWSGGGGGPMLGPTAAINSAGSQLLSHVAPTSFDPSFSSEMAYLNIPHSVTKVVPALSGIPEPEENNCYMRLAHAVSYGGLAFAIRIPHEGKKTLIEGCQSLERIGFPAEAYCNLAVVNYLLHGLQRYATYGAGDHTITGRQQAWKAFQAALSTPEGVLPNAKDKSKRSRDDKLLITEYYYKHVFSLLGVVHASDKQGGQHQGDSHPVVTWPVDYVVNLVVDGKVQNLTNIWCHKDICAGDDLILRLRYTRTTDYTLVAYPKAYTAKTFAPFAEADDGVWQLVPDIFDTVYRDPLSDGPVRLATEDPNIFDCRERGYWHVARSHAHWGAMPVRDIKGNDEGQYGNGALIQATLAPTFVDEYINDVDATVCLWEEFDPAKKKLFQTAKELLTDNTEDFEDTIKNYSTAITATSLAGSVKAEFEKLDEYSNSIIGMAFAMSSSSATTADPKRVYACTDKAGRIKTAREGGTSVDAEGFCEDVENFKKFLPVAANWYTLELSTDPKFVFVMHMFDNIVSASVPFAKRLNLLEKRTKESTIFKNTFDAEMTEFKNQTTELITEVTDFDTSPPSKEEAGKVMKKIQKLAAKMAASYQKELDLEINGTWRDEFQEAYKHVHNTHSSLLKVFTDNSFDTSDTSDTDITGLSGVSFHHCFIAAVLPPPPALPPALSTAVAPTPPTAPPTTAASPPPPDARKGAGKRKERPKAGDPVTM